MTENSMRAVLEHKGLSRVGALPPSVAFMTCFEDAALGTVDDGRTVEPGVTGIEEFEELLDPVGIGPPPPPEEDPEAQYSG